MKHVELAKNIYWVGVNDRVDTDLFEGLWPIPDGVTYNSYLLTGEKNVLIDLAKISKAESFLEIIAEVIPVKNLDYIVINHMEPDHTGVIKLLYELAPKVTFIVNEKTVELMGAFYGITDRLQVVKDGEKLSLGTHELQFFLAPFVHWPETMVTYETQTKILFPCDAFGSYGAFKGTIFDDSYNDEDLHFYLTEAKRYYANIVTKYSRMVTRAIDKLKGLKIAMIAPSHGLIWRKNPNEIIQLYSELAECGAGAGKYNAITVIWGSMYGNTETMMNAVVQGIANKGVAVKIHDASRIHPSYVLTDLLLNKGVLIGSPTYEGDIFHPIDAILQVALGKRIQNKQLAVFGSYGWQGGAVGKLQKLAEELRWNVIDVLEFQGKPTKELLEKGQQLGEKLAESLLS